MIDPVMRSVVCLFEVQSCVYYIQVYNMQLSDYLLSIRRNFYVSVMNLCLATVPCYRNPTMSLVSNELGDLAKCLRALFFVVIWCLSDPSLSNGGILADEITTALLKTTKKTFLTIWTCCKHCIFGNILQGNHSVLVNVLVCSLVNLITSKYLHWMSC